MGAAERFDALDDDDAVERELATWRHEIRLHALAQLANKPAKPPRWVRIGVFVVLILVLTASLVGLRRAMRPRIHSDETAIQILLIDESLTEPPSPLPPPLLPRVNAPVRVATQIPPPSDATPTAASAAPPESPTPPAPAYRVFNPDGSMILPSAAANQGMQASFVAQSTAASPIMRHQRPLKLRPNHFAQSWQAPPDETLLGAFVREHLTADTQFMTPWGTLVKCGVIVLMAGCTWGPPPVWQPTQTWRPASALDED